MCCSRAWYSISLSHNTSLIGCCVISLTPQSWRIPKQIAIDNQAVIKAVTRFHSTPGQQIINIFLSQMIELTNWHRDILFQIYWIPGHKGIPGNKKADKLAKLAAKLQSEPLPILPAILCSPLPHSTTTRKTVHAKQRKDILRALFQKSPRFDKIHAIDPKSPSSDYRELTSDLSCFQSSILIQLHTGHAQLNRHLHNIGAIATPILSMCNKKEETVWHSLISCMAHEKHRQTLINTLHQNALSIQKLLSDPTCVPHTLKYIAATGRFKTHSQIIHLHLPHSQGEE